MGRIYAKDKTEPRLLLRVGSCSCRGPAGDKTRPLAVPYLFVVTVMTSFVQTLAVSPNVFYISDITNSSSFSGKIFRKKSTLENFRANVLKSIDIVSTFNLKSLIILKSSCVLTRLSRSQKPSTEVVSKPCSAK